MERLLVITNLFPTPWEPARGMFNAQQIRQLSQNFDIQVWVPVAWPTWFSKPRQIRCAYRQSENVLVVTFPYFYTPGVLRWGYGLSCFVSLLLCYIRNRHFRPARVLGSWLYPDGVAAAGLARLLKVPYVLKAHGTDVNFHCRYPARAAQVRRAAAKAQAVYCVSNDLARELHQYDIARDNAVVIYNGVDAELFYPQSIDAARHALGLPSERSILLYVGNLKASKGIFDLLNAFSSLPSNIQGHLVFVGEGPEKKALNRRVTDMGLGEHVTLVGGKPHDELGRWMAAADALVLPSHAEGVPNVVLEALACGTPVVATAVGGTPEVLPSFAGLLVPAHEPGALADACVRVLRKNWNRDAIRRHAAGFSWQDNVAQLSRLWAVEDKGAPADD